jgi:hypothetical protein
MRIEDARDDDLPAILAIYNEVMRTSTAIYREEPATLEERQAWNETRKKNGLLLVARTDARPWQAATGDFAPGPLPLHRRTLGPSPTAAAAGHRHGADEVLIAAAAQPAKSWWASTPTTADRSDARSASLRADRHLRESGSSSGAGWTWYSCGRL